MESRDALAYFRCTVQPADTLAFERILNTPKRGLGEATLRLLHDHARAADLPLIAAAEALVKTEEMKPKARKALGDLLSGLRRWAEALATMRHTDVGEMILEESGYTEMWQNDRSAEAPGRLENLKELIRSMEEYDSLPSFLEHVALVMDAEQNAELDAVSIMTLHSAKGLEFETVFLPGWEEGLFPHQRALDEGGRSGLEEERRLAYVGLTRGKRRVKIWFVSNRRIHGLWQSTIPSRFLDELPEAHVEVIEANTNYGGYGASRWDAQSFSTTSYGTPGGRRAQASQGLRTGGEAPKDRTVRYGEAGATGENLRPRGRGADLAAKADRYARMSARNAGLDEYTETPEPAPDDAPQPSPAPARGFGHNQPERGGFGLYSSTRSGGPREIQGELVAKSVSAEESRFAAGARVFHQKFGNGLVAAVEGNKLTVDFDRAGRKRVLDSFVQPV